MSTKANETAALLAEPPSKGDVLVCYNPCKPLATVGERFKVTDVLWRRTPGGDVTSYVFLRPLDTPGPGFWFAIAPNSLRRPVLGEHMITVTSV